MSKYSAIAPKKDSELIDHFGSTYKYILTGSSVLDVGCSTGYYGRLLINNKQCEVDGIEIDPKDRAEASRHLRKVFDVNLDSKWPAALTSSSYDIIFLGDVIEHVLDAKSVLKRLGELLKKDGKIIISTPNIAHLTIRLELLAGSFEYEKTGILDETHLKYFTLGSLTNLIQEAGFNLDEIDYSLNELHPDTINHQLDQVGLKATTAFWEEIKKPEARAYQWKMVISKSTKKSQHKVVPPRKPMQNNYWFAGQTEKLINENSFLNHELSEHKNALKQVRRELSTTQNSFGYRVERKLKTILKKFT